MQHVIIIIFDSIKYEGSEIPLIETPLRDTKLKENFKIYYLKITPQKNGVPCDILYEVLPDKADPLSPIGNKFDFTSRESLSEAAAVIQSRQKGETNYYLISLGHGSGFGFFQRKEESIMTRADQSIENCSTPMSEKVDFRILWNTEFCEAFRAIKFKLAIFNNCNVTSLGNCAIFARLTEYLIGTQNFTTLKMLGFKKIIKSLLDVADNKGLEEVGEYVYDHYLISSLKVIIKNKMNTDETSMFYINLKNFEAHYNEFNKICLQLLSMAEEDIIRIRKMQRVIGASVSTIDLMEFLENVRLDKMATTGLKNEITDFLAAVEKSIIGKWRHENQIRLNGIAVYFPEIDGFEYEEKYQFYRNVLCSSKLLQPSNWDKLLDKVLSSLSR